MSVSLSSPSPTRAIVLDIEGTTTPVDFVYQVLFPYARAHLAAYLEREGESAACRAAIDQLHAEQSSDRAAGLQPPVPLVDYIAWLMKRDRKSPGLKTLQGLVWQEGFHRGELRGVVYPDVPRSLERWRARGIEIYIYSSGSVLAQQLLFGSTEAGDLTTFLKGYFDTAVGPKSSTRSYQTIAERLEIAPPEILFVSDVTAELHAARAAGLQVALCVRPGSAHFDDKMHPVIRSFDEVG